MGRKKGGRDGDAIATYLAPQRSPGSYQGNLGCRTRSGIRERRKRKMRTGVSLQAFDEPVPVQWTSLARLAIRVHRRPLLHFSVLTHGYELIETMLTRSVNIYINI